MTVYRIIKWFERHWWVLLLPVVLAVVLFFFYAHYHGHDLRKITFRSGGGTLVAFAFVGVVALFAICIVCVLELFRRDR
jgi:hypothetical protein